MEKPEMVLGSHQSYPSEANPFKNSVEPPNCQSSPPSLNQDVPNTNSDPENLKGFDFSDESIRKKFMRKVFTLLSVNDDVYLILSNAISVKFVFVSDTISVYIWCGNNHECPQRKMDSLYQRAYIHF